MFASSDKGEHFFDGPKDATKFGIRNVRSNADLKDLKANSVGEYRYQFDYEHSHVNDLRRGFGRYDVRLFNAKLSHVKDETDTIT